MNKQRNRKSKRVGRTFKAIARAPKAVYDRTLKPAIGKIGYGGVIGATLGSYCIGGPIGLVVGGIIGKYPRQTAKKIGDTIIGVVDTSIYSERYEMLDPNAKFEPYWGDSLNDDTEDVGRGKKLTKVIGKGISSPFYGIKNLIGSAGNARKNSQNYSALEEFYSKKLERPATFEDIRAEIVRHRESEE